MTRGWQLVAFVAFVISGASLAAQTAEPPRVTARIDNVTRVEAWAFFEPPGGGGDPDYTLVSNRARLAVQVDARRIWFEGSFQYSQLLGLPENAFGPGPLGPGAMYFAAARTAGAFQLYFKTMSVGVRNLLPHLSARAGRMTYNSGESTPFAGRLIGNAEWTPFERSFDGVRVDYERSTWRGHFSFVMPTQGVFEESASPTIGRVQLTSASWTTPQLSLFAHNYRDTRAVAARPDNTGIFSDRVNVNLQTLGASLDLAGVHAWGAVQRGNWFGASHRAFSASADYGRQWNVQWQPWMRGGVLFASGDRDPNDETHGTFFPMVPTTRPDLLRGTFAQMNVRDVYGTVAMQPRERLQITAELHHLSLMQRLDGWYSGTGATAFAGDYFGFTSRRSTLRKSLGTFAQVSAIARMNPYWTVALSAGVMRGADVIRRQFGGATMFVTAVESTVSLR